MGLLALLLCLIASPVIADQTVVGQFLGINNNDSSAVIGDNEAQDLLNVDLTPMGKSVKKRPGYGLYKALGTGQAIHGGHHFYNTGGSDVQVWGSSTSLYGITSDATPVQIISSATLNTTWDCADTQGHAYCVTSNRNLLLKTDGASITQWMTSPLGTMVTVTPDRLVVAGISGATNSLYFSQQNTFNNFTTGINEIDPFIEVIAAPGAAITHITWGCQKLLWWKNSSFGYITGDNQFNLGIVTVNDSIGTADNSSSIDPGGTVWFRGQDGHIYSYDCSALAKESIDITPLTQASAIRVANAWVQTTQADWQSGSVTTNGPTIALSTAIAVGSIVPSSITIIDTSSVDFSSGSGVGIDTFTVSGSVIPRTYLYDNFGTFDNWTSNPSGTYPGTMGVGGGQVTCSGASATACAGYSTKTVLPDFLIQCDISPATTGGDVGSCAALESTGDTGYAVYVDGSSQPGANTRLSRVSGYFNHTGDTNICTVSGVSSGYHSYAIVRYSSSTTIALFRDGTFICSGVDATYSSFNRLGMASGSNGSNFKNFYDIARLANFNSRVFDTAFSSPIYGTFNATTNSFTSGGVYSYAVRTSSNSGTDYGADTTVTNGAAITNGALKRYAVYSASISFTGASFSTMPQLQEVNIVAASTGTFYSAVNSAPTLSAWDTFVVTKQDNGGTHSFYIRSSTNSFTVLSATPTWVAQTAGAFVSASTGTYFQVRDDFTITSGTQAPSLDSFTLNYFQGTASDKAYSIYFDNAIWWSLAYGDGQASNNYIFKYDLINKAWLLYNIGSGGLIQQGQYLYFGSTSTANTFKYGSGTSDNGTAITAFWKSKDFAGTDPWLENQYNNIDSIYRTNENQSLTVSYALNTSTSTTSYTVNLSSTTQGIIRNKKILPNGKIGGNINVKFGDTSTNSEWELLGIRIRYAPQPYRPSL